MKTEWFLDGYAEWTGHDEDGPVQGFGEVTQAKLQADVLDVKVEYDGLAYEVHLERAGTAWTGKYSQTGGQPRPLLGRCSAVAIPGDGSDRSFRGEWLEDDTTYRWELLLRAGVSGRRPPTPGPRPPSIKPPPRPDAGMLANEATKEKVRRVIRALEEVVRGRAASPQLVADALKIHAVLERGARKPTRKRRAGAPSRK